MPSRRSPPTALIEALKGVGYEAHELDAGLLSATETDKQARDLLMRLGVAFFSMMNVMLLSVAVWSGAEGVDARSVPLDFRRHRPADGGLCRPALLQIGLDCRCAPGGWGWMCRSRLALILASSISLFETFHSGHHAYFDAAVMLCFFLLIGRYLDHRTRAIARSAAEELAALEVPRADRAAWTGPRWNGAISEVAGRRYRAGAARRADAGGWRGDRRHLGGGPQPADRRKPAGLCR